LHHENKTAVENMVWSSDMLEDGEYTFKVHNYSTITECKKGFRAEIAFGGHTYSFDYSNTVKSREYVTVANVNVKNGKITLGDSLPHSESDTTVWGVATNKLIPVTSIMYSPNYWDENKVGNKHVFFMLKDCINPEEIRGLYNEHIHDKYRPLRKSIDMLAELAKCKPTDNQISGLGFSSTLPMELTVVVRGKEVSGTYKVINKKEAK